jgi:hypothetical protein
VGKNADRERSFSITVNRVEPDLLKVTVIVRSRGEKFQCEIPSDALVAPIIQDLAEELHLPPIDVGGM